MCGVVCVWAASPPLSPLPPNARTHPQHTRASPTHARTPNARNPPPPPTHPMQVRQFVERFMPAYRCYLPALYTLGPTTAAPGRLLVVEVDESREPVARQPEPVM